MTVQIWAGIRGNDLGYSSNCVSHEKKALDYGVWEE
jgi:hypothetical protein